MKLRGSRFVAVLFPVAVAIIPVSLLIWYDVRRIPSREEYLNQRNLRLLSTLGGAIKARIDSFDGALDSAVKSFPFDAPDPQQRFKQRVALFAPDLQILKLRVTKGDRTLPMKTGEETDHDILAADDPPVIRVGRDEGRYYLYLGAKLEDQDRDLTTRILARAKLDAVLAPLLDRNQDFSAVLVATSAGDVIAQNSRIGLTLSRLDTGISPPPDDAGKDTTSRPNTLSSAGSLASVIIGGVSYKQYVQSIPLSLLSPQKKSEDDSRQPEEWFVGGLVLEEQFKSDGAALSFTTLLWFSAFLAIIAFSLPFLKLRALSARERLCANDACLATAMSLMAIGLLTLAVMGGLTFGRSFRQTVDSRLRSVADGIARNLDSEVRAIDLQGEAFDAYLGSQHIFTRVSDSLQSNNQPFPWMGVDPDDGGHYRISCTPKDACRTALLHPAPDEQSKVAVDQYPFFDLVTWAGDDGWQRVRWTPGTNIRPFINIFDQVLPYAESARAAWRANVVAKGVDVASSPTTGVPLTAFWRATPDQQWNRVQSLALTTPVSLDRPVLPNGVSFAVVNRDGGVLFHTISNRRLQENFLTECGDDIRLRALLQEQGDGDQLSVMYRGRDQRLRVQPLRLSALQGKADPGWQLAVFQDSAIGDTLNLETLTLASALFAMYLGILATIGTMIYVFAPWQPKWFWPDPEKRPAYRAAALLNAGAAAIFIVVLTIGTRLNQPDVILVATLGLALGMILTTYRLIVRARRDSDCRDPFTWRDSFFVARAAFLLVVAALPAMACFNVAYWFEATLLTNLENVRQAADVADLTDRIAARAAQVGHAVTGTHDPETQLREFVGKNTHPALFAEAEPAEVGALQSSVSPLKTVGSRWLSSLLIRIHRRYNDTAGALESSVAGDKTVSQATSPVLSGGPPIAARIASLVVWLVAIVVALFAACFGFVYWLVKPMFALQAVAPPLPPPVDPVSGRVLQIGPVGSGKSTNLALVPTRKIIDIAMGSPLAPRPASLANTMGAGRIASGGLAVGRLGVDGLGVRTVATIDVPTAAFDPVADVSEVGIDHVDYRIEEPEFGGQTLTLIERVLYGDCPDVRVVCDRDPLVCLQQSGAPASDIDRWVRALRSCRKEMVRVDGSTGVRADTTAPASRRTAAEAVLDECCGIPALESIGRNLVSSVQSSGLDDALAAFGAAAAPYYESLWRGCTKDERLTLRQLAEEGMVNPQNHVIVRNLMRTGLIVRDPILRIMNCTFSEFVSQATSVEQVNEWERRGVVIPWGSIELAILSVVVILAVLLVGTQRQVINAWVGIIPLLLPAGQKAFTSIAALWPGSKAGTVA